MRHNRTRYRPPRAFVAVPRWVPWWVVAVALAALLNAVAISARWYC